MAQTTFDYFKTILIVQLFFGFSLTVLTYAMPDDALNYVTLATPEHLMDVEDTAGNIESSLTKQTQIPLVDVASLVFYSGNIVLDMILNSIFAIPELISGAINLVFFVMPIDAYLQNYLKVFVFAIICVIYVIGILQFLMNFRSGSTIA